MDLKELGYFRAIAEAGTFAKAAAKLRVAQPALSRQIQKLERSLRVELLRRSPRGVTVTAAGAALLRRTIALEKEVEDVRREVSSFSDEVVGSLRIAAPYPISTLMLPRLLAAYHKSFPAVALHAFDGYSGNLTDNLLNESLDVAIASPTSHLHVDLTVVPLWTSELRLVAPASAASNALFKQDFIALADVATLPLILPSSTNAIRRIVSEAFARHHLRLDPIIESDGPLMTFAMVTEGLGYTLFPHTTFIPQEESGELISRPVVPAILRTIAVITRSALLQDRSVSHFIQLAKEAAAHIVTTDRFRSTHLYQE
jgi:LysR family nitrogen assimilation transcriptional regulator